MVITKREKSRKFIKAAWQSMMVRELNSTPLFIFGEMRSGTNMLTDCLDRCWSIATYNESDEEAFRGYALRSDDVVSSLVERSRAKYVVFKSLADSARARQLLGQFPSAKAIWIFRNYQDVVNSAMKKWTEHNKYLSYILYETEKAGWRAENLPDSLLEVIRENYSRGISDSSARALIWYIRNSLYFEQGLQSMKNVLLVRYEELAQSPTQEFERVFDFIGLPLRSSYFGEVSTRSIRRDVAPQVDRTIADMCDSLQQQLILQLRADCLR